MSNQHSNNNQTQKQRTESQPPMRMGRRGGGPTAMMPGEKARDFKGTFKRLIQYLGKYNLLILFVLLLSAGSTFFSILGPKILGRATTLIFEGVA